MSYDPFNWVVLFTLALGLITAVAGVIWTILRLLRKSRHQLSISFETPEGEKYRIEGTDLSPEELEKVIKSVHLQKKKTSAGDRESGAVLVEILFGIVPAIIALSFVATIVYLVVQEKKVPGVLVNSLTTIIGYYFGIGASGTLSTGKKLSREEVQQLLADH